MEKRVTIFCASSTKIDPKYNAAAREVVRALHALGSGVVSGGGAIGTMGAITDESVRVGGHHTAVLPRFMKGLENPAVKDVVWTETMSERKECMREGTCAAIALPGGTGTLDELVETYVLKRLDRYPGMVIALDLDGFYEPFKRMLDHYVQTDMMPAKDLEMIHFPRTVEELAALFKQ